MTDNDELYEERLKETEIESSEAHAHEIHEHETSAAEAREADLEGQRLRSTQETHPVRNLEESGRLSWLNDDEINQLQSRWNSIQTRFVDDPHSSVKQADELVSEALQRIQQSFTDQRTDLESRWNKEENVSTEDLRVGLQNYRSFFNRLLKF
jgi:hypothetical protein